MAFIFMQSSLPADLSSEESQVIVDLICRVVRADPEMVTFFVRKAAHFAEYFALGASLAAALRTAGVKMPVPAAEVTGVLYAVSDEIHQRFVTGRSCELRDVLIDGAGVFCGIIFFRILASRFPGMRKQQKMKHDGGY